MSPCLVALTKLIEYWCFRNSLFEFFEGHTLRSTLKTNGRIDKDQEKVANILANYFSTMANNVGGAGVHNLTEDDLSKKKKKKKTLFIEDST